MTLEAGKEMDRRCVINWLLEVYRHPNVAFYTHSDEQQREYAHDAIALLKEDCHNCKLECLLQKYDELKEKYDKLLKEQEAVEPYMDFDGHDVWRCGKCGATIFHVYQNASDEDAKNYAKFCRHCGKAVKWE